MPGPSDNMQVEVVAGIAELTLDPTNLTLEATQLLVLAELETANAALVTLNTAIGDAADEAGDPTVIGLLKQIVVNTTPAP